jgi:protein-S-isoprenylcysteine O-methyltransferase Ste14
MEIDRNSAGVAFPPPLVFAGALLLGIGLGRHIGDPGIPLLSRGTLHGTGLLALLLGLGILFSATGLFARVRTDPRPWKAAEALVTDGVYRWTRNPMYLGMALIHAGIALWLDSLAGLLALVPVVAAIQRWAIAPEEAYLAARFGDAYGAYRARVRRWI